MTRVLTQMPQVRNRVGAETTQVDEGGETTRLGGETTQAEDDVGGTTWAVSGEMNHEHVGAQVGGERTLKGELAQVGEAIRHCSCLLLHASLELYIITWKYYCTLLYPSSGVRREDSGGRRLAQAM